MAADVDELFTVAPEEFVATRNALVKALRAAGQKDEAAQVANLRRPSPSDWALNVTAHRHPDDVSALLDAAADLRRVQAGAIEGRGGDLRGALAAMRTASTAVHRRADEVLADAGRDRSTQAAAITSRLAEVATNEAAGEQLRAGRLGTAPVDDADPFAGLEPAAVAPRSKPEAKRRARPTTERDSEPEPAPARPRPDPAERRRRQKAVADAHRAVAAADTAVTKAESRVADAQRDLDAATARRGDAQAALEEAEAALARHDADAI
ncbi:MAG TPA: hypothetical protein VGF22_15525 [Acidimicrobiales bacterium]